MANATKMSRPVAGEGLLLQPVASNAQWWFGLLASLFALFCWQWVNLQPIVSYLGSAAIALFSVKGLNRPQVVKTIRFSGEKGWLLSLQNEMPAAVTLLQPCFISAYAAAMSFVDAGGQRYHCCLFHDSVTKQQHRKLRMVLNTIKAEQPEVAGQRSHV